MAADMMKVAEEFVKNSLECIKRAADRISGGSDEPDRVELAALDLVRALQCAQSALDALGGGPAAVRAAQAAGL